jgi:hypothetical protein
MEADKLQSVGRQERQLQLAVALAGARADPARWWQVAVWLAASDSGHDNGMIFSHDLTTRPGWSLLSGQERQDVLNLGIEYINIHQIEPSGWIGRAEVPVRQVAADWSGVYLLTTLATHNPAQLAAVTQPAWRSWAPAIMGAWSSGTEGGERARCLLADLVPADGKQAIVDAALGRLDALQQHGGGLSPRQLYDHLSLRLVPELAKRLLGGSYSGPLAQDVVNMLVDDAPQAALDVCRGLLAGPDPALAAAARRGLARLDPPASLTILRRPAPPRRTSPASPLISTSAVSATGTLPPWAACYCGASRSAANRLGRMRPSGDSRCSACATR